MIPCTSCNRHYTTTAAACPFFSRPSGAARALQSVGAALTTIVLAACYGGFNDDMKWDSYGSGDTGTPPTTTDLTDETGVSDTGTASDTGTNDTSAPTDTGTTSDTATTGATDTGSSATTSTGGSDTTDTGL
jgi:hypothetical protein